MAFSHSLNILYTSDVLLHVVFFPQHSQHLIKIMVYMLCKWFTFCFGPLLELIVGSVLVDCDKQYYPNIWICILHFQILFFPICKRALPYKWKTMNSKRGSDIEKSVIWHLQNSGWHSIICFLQICRINFLVACVALFLLDLFIIPTRKRGTCLHPG